MYITWADLCNVGLAILFVLGVALAAYILILVRNLNSSLKVVKRILKDNEENISKTLNDVPTISKNLVEITQTVKGDVKVLENTISSLNDTMKMIAIPAGTIKHNIIDKINSVVELIDLIKHIFFKEKEEKVEKAEKVENAV